MKSHRESSIMTTTAIAVLLLVFISSTFGYSFENDNHARVLRRRWIPWTMELPFLPNGDYWTTGVNTIEQPRVVAVSAANEENNHNEVDNVDDAGAPCTQNQDCQSGRRCVNGQCLCWLRTSCLRQRT